MLCDALLINLSMIIPFIIRFYESNNTVYYLKEYLNIAPYATIIFLVIFYVFKLYNRSWAYASVGELVAIVQAVSLGCLGVITLKYFSFSIIPRSVILLGWAFAIILIGLSRLGWRILIERQKPYSNKPHRKCLIIGAGGAGAMVARELKSYKGGIIPVGFIDDDPNKQKLNILSLPVMGGRDKIPSIVKSHDIDLIIIAMPSVSAAVTREIVEICKRTKAELKILPGMYQIIDGQVSVNHLRPVQLEDLLHREPVHVDLEEIAGYLKGETVLITGAGGSIGSELCRQVALFKPCRLILLGHGENSIYNIWLEMKDKVHGIPLEIEIADIRDKPKVDNIFQKHRPGVVFHAAAHKHVPLMELHPDEAVKTNIFGTLNLAEASDQAGTKIFVLISTDKAVNPSSVMGATKRIAELIIQQMNRASKTKFTAVRFGNVLGSNGSVVPLFQRQIKNGGPITVTHPEMMRYFMTIPEAVQLVIQAGAMSHEGEIFILDMGEPVKIVDLARDMIRLTGLEPDKDIDIEFVGLRPGEKLFEELLTAEEGSCTTRHKRIYVAKPYIFEVSTLEEELLFLRQKDCQLKTEDVFSALSVILPKFKSYRKVQVV
jgi:FlaA1/EpsC-like NDP-sugar epimerase